MADGELDKSEEPTSFKLKRSRQKGIVARSADLGFAAGLASLLAFAWAEGPHFARETARVARDALITAPQAANAPGSTLILSASVLSGIERPLVFLAAATFLIVLAFELAQTGFVFSFAPLKPDFSRLNPGAGLKRIFTLRMLIETGKNLLKLAVYATLAWLVIRAGLRLAASGATDARLLLLQVAVSAFRLLACFLGAAAIFALLDQFLARRLFRKQMRMSRRELKKEIREREGDPRIKQKRKQLHAQFAKAAAGLRAVRGSDVLITNPTRLAVALKYVPGEDSAPLVTARGAHDFAARMRQLAAIYGIIIVEDKALARDLYSRCLPGSPIPDDQFRRVAAIYRNLPSFRPQSGSNHV